MAQDASSALEGGQPSPGVQSAATGTDRGSARRSRFTALALFALCLAAYLANGRTLPLAQGGDTIPTRLIPFSLLAHGTLSLDPFAAELRAVRPDAWYMGQRRGSVISTYPVCTALLVLPVYAPVYAYLRLQGRTDVQTLLRVSEPLEKVAAALLTAAAVALCYLALRRRDERSAPWIALALGLGSSLWATASQQLWQHGAVALALSAGLLALARPQPAALACAGAGLALGLGGSVRPTAGLFVLAGLAALLLARDAPAARVRRALFYALGSAPPLLAVLAYNLYYFDNPLGGYGVQQPRLRAGSPLVGFAGLLVSPNRGLLVFTPTAAIGIWGLVRALRTPRQSQLLLAFGAAALVHGLGIASYREWAGGWSFGPRYMTDIVPILALGAAEIVPQLGRTALRALLAPLAWSVAVQANGSFCYPASRWDPRMQQHGLERSAWSLRDFELWQDFRTWLAAESRTTPF